MDAPPAPPDVPDPIARACPLTCGPDGTSDCCATAEVPGGTFLRGWDASETPRDDSAPATISAFRLDVYEVTVARFRPFAATLESHAGLHCRNTATWTDEPGANEQRPINCVTWGEAAAFCAADGGRLPTEAEWNFAAAGGNEQRAYPWSNPAASTSIDDTRASYGEGGDCVADGRTGCSLTDLLSPGARPAGNGRWGHADLAGNVWEWVLDLNSYYVTPCVDCARTEPDPRLGSASAYRVFRGGGYSSIAKDLRTGNRLAAPPDRRDTNLGFRCAR